MKKIFLLLALSLCLVGCSCKETREHPFETQHVEVDENGNVHIIIGEYIMYRYIDEEYIVDGTNLTAEELLGMQERTYKK